MNGEIEWLNYERYIYGERLFESNLYLKEIKKTKL